MIDAAKMQEGLIEDSRRGCPDWVVEALEAASTDWLQSLGCEHAGGWMPQGTGWGKQRPEFA